MPPRTYLLLLLVVLLCGPCRLTEVSAQNYASASKHDIRLTFGMLPVSEHFSLDDWGANDGYQPPLLSDLFTYAGAKHTTGAISLAYACRMKKWLSIGAEFTYTGTSQQFYERFTHERIYSRNKNKLSLSPMCRFTYLNRRNIQLYSQISIGIGLYMERGYGIASYNDVNCDAHLTYLGISFGRKLYGTIELGSGNRGMLSAGIGYRFNQKKIKP